MSDEKTFEVTLIRESKVTVRVTAASAAAIKRRAESQDSYLDDLYLDGAASGVTYDFVAIRKIKPVEG